MNRLIYTLWTILFILIISSCSDETKQDPITKPSDNYAGTLKSIRLSEGCTKLDKTDFVLYLKSSDGIIINRSGSHIRQESGESLFSLQEGLKEGVYQLLYLEYELPDKEKTEKFNKGQFGLGCSIEISEAGTTLLDKWNSTMNMFGSGTSDDPYEISSWEHLIYLQFAVNDSRTNEEYVSSEVHFKQACNIDGDRMSWESDHNYGWNPIGMQTTVPFRAVYDGGGYTIDGLWIKREHTSGVGLFGFIYGARIMNLTMEEAEIGGDFGVGSIAGISITGDGKRVCSSIENCTVKNSKIIGADGSFAVGGILGCVDMSSALNILNCKSTDSTIASSYNAGGLIGSGSLYTNIIVSECENNSSVTAEYSGSGGIVAACDTIIATSCVNKGQILGATKYQSGDTENSGRGTGGIVGGSGISYFTTCTNSGVVKGYEGVGGIIGSTLFSYSKERGFLYNNTLLRYCGNSGEISGNKSVGGLGGEAQFGCYGGYNKASVTSNTDYAGGIVGNAPLAVVHNAVNSGVIQAKKYAGGIIGLMAYGSVAINHNYGSVSTESSHAGGIAALAGNNTIVNYCGNFAPIYSGGDGPVGGIIGEIGDPREWTGMDIFELVIGATEIVLGFAGPVLAYIEPANAIIQSVHHYVEIGETILDKACLFTDIVLFGLGIDSMCSPEELEEMKTSINQSVTTNGNTILSEIELIRMSCNPNMWKFPSTNLTNNYNSYITNLTSFYQASSENCDLFNDNINTARELRREEIENFVEIKEIVHTTIAGVSIALGVAVSVVAIVGTGGAATPAVIAIGSVGSLLGGANAVSKVLTDHAENVVIVSQCVNSGIISCANTKTNNAGGIVGELQDRSIVRDCLNTASGIGSNGGGHIIGNMHPRCEVHNCLTIAEESSWENMISSHDAMYEDSNLYYCKEISTSVPNVYMSPNRKVQTRSISWGTGLSSAEIATASNFEGWDIGNQNNKWTIPTGVMTYPIPFVSEYSLSSSSVE